ncbi:MAG: hypothetical protein RL324_1965 [Verrucomicrobiota bacterium]|jgi:hypothetical protein
MSSPEQFVRSPLARHAFSLLVGLTVGVFLHYLLYRLGLPIQPFIYVAF